MNAKILLVDDDPDVLVTYAEILGDHGFLATCVRTREEALTALDAVDWDVVVVDEHLSGPGGPATATSLLGEIAARAPQARSLVITGFATPHLVKAALAAGAWDYMDKSANFLPMLLPLRVRHAVEAARERRLRVQPPAQIENDLRATWTAALQPGLEAHRKGRLLEETLALLFRTIPGLNEVRTNRISAAEEFDVVVVNASTDPVLAKEGSFFLVECKNWSRPVDPKELDYLRQKMRDRHGRVRLGLLIGVAGFTAGLRDKLDRMTNEDHIVLPIDADALSAWIDASDRVAWLRERVVEASLRT